MSELGLVDVAISEYAPGLIISYENYGLRTELEAMRKILTQVLRLYPDKNSVILIPLNRGVPLLVMRVNMADYLKFTEQRIDEKQFRTKINIINVDDYYQKRYQQFHKLSNRFFRTELIINPHIRGMLHSPEGLALWNIDFAPQLAINLWIGTWIIIEGLLPICYQYNRAQKYIKPGRILLNHTWRFPKNLWASASIGAFDRNRYGLSIELIKFLWKSQITLMHRLDYTGYLHYEERNWFYSKLYQLSYWFGMVYRFSNIDFLINIGWGRYLFDDTAWKLEIIRSFGEFELGFYGLWQNPNKPADFLAGVRFTIPLPFFSWKATDSFRIRNQSSYSWGIQYHTDLEGRFPDSGNDIQLFRKKLFPTYLYNNIYMLK